MKKWMCLLLALTLLAAFSGCGKQEPAVPSGIDGTPEEIIAKIYENHKTIDLALVGMDVDLADENAVEYYTGLANGEALSAAAVSETMLGQPYSLVVARVGSGADAAKIAREMYEKIDTRKWICVAADTKTAAYSGDVVMFFMIDSSYADIATPDSVFAAFKAACGGNATAIS